MAYERKNGPLDLGLRGDYQAAVVAKIIADVNTKKGRRNKFQNFLLTWGGNARGGRADETALDRG